LSQISEPPNDDPTLDSKVDFRIQYGADPLQFADVRVPSSKKPWPVVMNIHGGFWRAKYDLIHTNEFCAAITSAGFVTFNVEYRRVGNLGGGWPGTFDDIRRSFQYLLEHASELGFDPEHILVIGHSAGGHLALCLAAHEPKLTRVISLAGVTDLNKAYEQHLSNNAVVEFLGGTPKQVPELYRQASPLTMKVQARQAVITGLADDTVPPAFSRDYAKAKAAVGEIVEHNEIANANHFDLIDPRSEAFQIILKIIQEMMA
jgi:acetyl esterase/lipase